MAEQEMKIAESSPIKISTQRIICPLCPNIQGFSLHRLLLKHLTDFHEIKITRSNQQFSNFEEFTVWRNQGNREVNYVSGTSRKDKKGEKIITFNCNRSDIKGYISTCKERNTKIGGSIKIKGVCPSRIEARILINGQVSTDFIETHVGHGDELRTKRLKKTEELQIVEKLKGGVPNSRILQDAREIADKTVTRMNVLTPQDLTNIKLRHNVDNRRHKDDMIATAFKIRDWDEKDQNQAFLFKNIDEDEDSDQDRRLYLSEPTTSRFAYLDDIKIEESASKPERLTSLNCDNKKTREEEILEMYRLMDHNKQEGLWRWMVACTEGQREREICKKRKIEKQTYYPKKK